MTPSYISVARKAVIPMPSLWLQKITSFGLLGLLLLSFNLLQAQVVISEVFDDGSFELTNTGNSTADISGYWICDFPRYRALSAITKECGDFNLAPNGVAVFSDASLFQIDDSELGLYTRDAFSDATALISYLEWGSNGHQRSGLAIGNGIWDGNAVTAFSSGQSLELSGDKNTAAGWTLNDSQNACATNNPPAPPAATSSARYRVTFGAAWSAATHPTDYPSNAHFSGLIGLTHTANVALFPVGTVATPGIVSMAETGAKGTLTTEIQAIIDGGQGQTLVSGGGVNPTPGSVSVEFDVSNSHPLVSITTMIAPSPDWFVAIKDLDLFANGDWVNSTTLEVGSYDAGSDSGTTFTSANQATSPAGTIAMITDGPLVVNGAIPSMGTMTFTRIDAGACDAEGGTLAGGPFTFCVDGEADNIPAGSITLNGNTGTNNQWVVTDEQGNILGLPPMPSAVNFDDAGAGVCLVWNLAYEDGLTGLMTGNNVSQLEGCFNLSNSVSVTRNQPAGGTLSGGPFTVCVDGEADNIPAGSITLNGNTGTNNQWVVTDEQGNILGLPPMPSAVNFDDAGAGVCLVWNLAYEDGLTGLMGGNNVSQLEGCYSLSNSVSVTRNQPAGGTLTGGPFTFCVDGVADNIPANGITLSGNTGANSQWVITDDQGKILGLPGSFTGPDFDGAGVGVCQVWHLSYEDGLEGLAADNNVSDLVGCYNFSNPITVTRQDCGDMCAATGGTLAGGPFTFCVDGEADNIPAGSITLSGNTGTNNQWVVTDPNGNILGLPPMPSAVNFDDAGAGVCLVWNLAYEDGLAGLMAGNNVSQLEGCYSLSNSVSVTRNQPAGGTLVGGPFTFCVDGEADNIPAGSISLSGNIGANNQWVVTDPDGNILGLPPMPSAVNFDDAGAGVCLVWNLAYEDGLTGLTAGNNVSQLEGCYSLSNSVSVTRNQPAGGTLAGGPFTFCVDGVADNIPADGITLSGNTGANSQWVITDDQGKILGLPGSFTGPDFDGAGVGVCQVWHLSYEDGLEGLAVDNNVSDLAGCYNFSNPITVTRQDCGDMCAAVGGTLAGGPFTFCVDGEADNIPAGSITLAGNTGTNNQWVVTDPNGNILGLPPMPSAVNFDDAGAGVCLVWNLAYEDGLTGLTAGNNVSQLEGCYSLSNSVSVTRNKPAGGTLTGGPFTFCVDGVADNIPANGITLSENSGTNSQWVITDDQGKILGLPGSFTGPDFDGAGIGVCQVWHLSYEDGLEGLAADNNVSELEGCYNFSNPITVTRQDCGDMCTAQGGALEGGPFTFCVDGVADNIPAGSIALAGNSGANNQWVVTDLDGNILGLPPMPSVVNFDDAGAGVCLIWNLAFEDGLTGLQAGNNVSQLAGCYSLSNSVTVTRNQPIGGTLVGGPFTFCVDGEADNIPADGITLSGNSGTNSQWVITDDQGNILGLPPTFAAPDFDAAGIGVCQVWHLSYEDGLTGLAAGNNVNELEGCYNFSNNITVTREECTDNATCTAPSDVNIDILGPRKIVVDWNDVDDAAQYIVEIRFAGRDRVVGRGKIRRSKVFIFAPSNRDYEIQIKTVCQDGGESVFTEWFPFSTPAVGGFTSANGRNADNFTADVEIASLENKALTAYPNPVSDLLNVNYTITAETGQLEIFHVSGQKVMEQTLSTGENTHQINLSNLTEGLYLLRITEQGNAPVTKRIIKGSQR